MCTSYLQLSLFYQLVFVTIFLTKGLLLYFLKSVALDYKMMPNYYKVWLVFYIYLQNRYQSEKKNHLNNRFK